MKNGRVRPSRPSGATESLRVKNKSKQAKPIAVIVPALQRVKTWMDLTITVKKEHDIPGYGPWTYKDGAPHVQPPENPVMSKKSR